MIAKHSPLRLSNFEILKSDFKTLYTEGIPAFSIGYDLDINYDIKNFPATKFFPKQEETSIAIVVDLKVQSLINGEDYTGYDYRINSTSIFILEETPQLNEHARKNLEAVSTVAMAISNTRGFMRNITGYMTFGQHLLPSVDLLEVLLANKKENPEEENPLVD